MTCVVTARFKLATLVQYVPLPVVGGYLGYVGYFCLAAGIGLGTSTTIDTFGSWANLATKGVRHTGGAGCTLFVDQTVAPRLLPRLMWARFAGTCNNLQSRRTP